MFDTDVGLDNDHSSSFAYISIPRYALRELWLAARSRSWVPVEAIVQSCHRTLGGYRETIRVEVWYGYKMNEAHYAGRLIRDTGFYLGKVRKIVDHCPPGKTVFVRVNPGRPDQSYLPSGMGYLEPFVMGIVSLGTIVILSAMVFVFLLGPIINHFLH